MNGGAIAPPTMDMTMSEEPSLVWSPSPRMPSAKIVGNMTDMKKNVPNNAIQAQLAAAHAHRRQHHIDGRVSRQHQMRLELADDGAAAKASDREQDKTDCAQHRGGFRRRHVGVVLNDVIDAETENARLRRDVKKLRDDAQRKMFAPEHVPVL